MNPSLKLTDLKQGDILIQHRHDKDPTKELITHAAIVATHSVTEKEIVTDASGARFESKTYTIPHIFEMKVPTGHCLNTIYGEKNKIWSVYRLIITSSMESREETKISRLLPYKAASIGYLWVFYKNYKYKADYKADYKVTNSGTYSKFSIVSAFLGSSEFSAYAQAYANSLWKNNRTQPPPDLIRMSNQCSCSCSFSGEICSYLPIALYQAAMGLSKAFIYMALNAKQSLPRDLARYLTVNKYWSLVGTVSGKSG
ncbi:hypothetical protein [Endozoicomonas lisbonensis]|uniref:Uncharacterized protein n=1 Tax=Endozoicomonas lisbonensis TaxID=3120522 RepID=A0ABV2SNR2_9GAMM